MNLLSSISFKLLTMLVSASLLSGGFAAKHPLHVSTTEANYNLKEKTLEITCAIFTDDFESILSSKYKQKIDLVNPSLHKQMDAFVSRYVASHLAWKINGKLQQPKYLGYEIDHESVNIYFEIPQVPFLKTVETSNTLLYDLFNDQISILHISKGTVRKSTKLGYPDKNFAAEFN